MTGGDVVFPESNKKPARAGTKTGNSLVEIVLLGRDPPWASRMQVRKRAREDRCVHFAAVAAVHSPGAGLMCGVSFWAFLFVSLAFVDPATPMDDRISRRFTCWRSSFGMYACHRDTTHAHRPDDRADVRQDRGQCDGLPNVRHSQTPVRGLRQSLTVGCEGSAT